MHDDGCGTNDDDCLDLHDEFCARMYMVENEAGKEEKEVYKYVYKCLYV